MKSMINKKVYALSRKHGTELLEELEGNPTAVALVCQIIERNVWGAVHELHTEIKKNESKTRG